MVGIESFGAYIPKYRLKRDEIAKALGVRSQGGEKAVANFDEDAVTLVVEALNDAIAQRDTATIDGLFLASTTFPYQEKSAASLVSAVLDLKQRLRTADFSDSLRCATIALRAAVDSVQAGSAKAILVGAADVRTGDPETDLFQLFGDGAAALLIGSGKPVVTIEHSYSWAEETTDYWRKDKDPYVLYDDPAFAVRYGYIKVMKKVIADLLSEAKMDAKAFSKAVYNAPDPKCHLEIAKAFGFDPASQVQDPLFKSVGQTGCAAALLSLVAALKEAKEGDRLLLANYGNGCDAFVLKIQPGIEAVQREIRGVQGHLMRRKDMDFKKYTSFRKLLK